MRVIFREIFLKHKYSMVVNSVSDTFKLANGVEMPCLGLGTWQSQDGPEVQRAVTWALHQGYRHIDTAAIYRNEIGIGQAVASSGLDRKEIFITSKVWNPDQGFEETLRAFDQSLKKLNTDYLDLYLIHWPVKGQFLETWRALEYLYQEGRVRAIGVSNFMVHHLHKLLETCEFIPMVNQFEFHPRLGQPDLVRFCRDRNILVEAWSPMMKGRVNDIYELVEIGKDYNKSAAQVSLRWALQKGIVVIPKSVRLERIKENAQLFDFELDDEEMALIDGLDQDIRIGPDPNNFNF